MKIINGLSFGIDLVSRRQYTIQIKNLETKKFFLKKSKILAGGATWASDNKTIFYVQK